MFYRLWFGWFIEKKMKLFSLFCQLYVNFWQFLLPFKLSFFLSFHLCRVFLNPHVFQIWSRDSIHISFIFIPLHKRATIDTNSSIKKTHFTLCASTINFSSFVTTKFGNVHSWRGELTSTSRHWFWVLHHSVTRETYDLWRVLYLSPEFHATINT